MRTLSTLIRLLIVFQIFFTAAPVQAQVDLIVRSQEVCPGVEARVSVHESETRKNMALSAISHALTGARESCAILGEWDKRSQTIQLNEHAGQGPIPVGRDLQFLLPQVIRMAEQTSGAFDPTAWSKHRKGGYRDIWFEAGSGRAMLKTRGATLSFRGLLKGYLADRIAARLESHGFHDYLISVGGTALKAQGHGPQSSWMTGINDPRQPQAESVCRVALVNRSMVTVSDKFWGSTPASFPGAASYLSVTILAPYAHEANALANAAMVMGARIRPLIEGGPQRGAVLMDHQGRLQVIGSVPAACMY